MAKVAVWAKIPAAPGKRDDLAKALEVGLETAKGESGTIYYILHTDPTDADALYMYEKRHQGRTESLEGVGTHVGFERPL
ncbi:MAG: putative quinol monooxygenase, partial [Actinomycetota bacterium]